MRLTLVPRTSFWRTALVIFAVISASQFLSFQGSCDWALM